MCDCVAYMRMKMYVHLCGDVWCAMRHSTTCCIVCIDTFNVSMCATHCDVRVKHESNSTRHTRAYDNDMRKRRIIRSRESLSYVRKNAFKFDPLCAIHWRNVYVVHKTRMRIMFVFMWMWITFMFYAVRTVRENVNRDASFGNDWTVRRFTSPWTYVHIRTFVSFVHFQCYNHYLIFVT